MTTLAALAPLDLSGWDAALDQLARFLRPELAVTLAVLAALGAELIVRPANRRWVGAVALAGLVGATLLALDARHRPVPADTLILGGLVAADRFATFFRVLLYGGAALALLAAMHSRPLRTRREGEFYTLMAALALGMAALAFTNNLLLLYLALEVTSLLGYVLAGYQRRAPASAEAGLKYVVYGAAASGVMIFGISLLWGLTGTLELTTLGERLGAQFAADDGGRAWVPAFALLLLVLVGLAYKIAAFPFHMWSPDVYEGAPTATAAFLSIGPKAAGFAALLRLLAALHDGLGGAWRAAHAAPDQAERLLANLEPLHVQMTLALVALAFATMTIGNLMALLQDDAKRLLAFSSIAHSGYLLAAVAAWWAVTPLAGPGAGPAAPAARDAALEAVLFYLPVYVFMNLGAFFVVICLENGAGSTKLRDFAGALQRAPLLVAVLGLCLFSLVGLPPLAGFVAKWYLLKALLFQAPDLPVAGTHYFLAAAVVGNSVISLFYYVRLIKPMVADPAPVPAPPGPGRAPAFTALLLAAPVLALGLFWGPLAERVRCRAPYHADDREIVAPTPPAAAAPRRHEE